MNFILNFGNKPSASISQAFQKISRPFKKSLAERPVEGGAQLSSLPTETIHYILSLSSGTRKGRANALNNFGLTSHYFYTLASDHQLWQKTVGTSKWDYDTEHAKYLNLLAMLEHPGLCPNPKELLLFAFRFEKEKKLKQLFFDHIISLIGVTDCTRREHGDETLDFVKLANDALDRWGSDLDTSDTSNVLEAINKPVPKVNLASLQALLKRFEDNTQKRSKHFLFS